MPQEKKPSFVGKIAYYKKNRSKPAIAGRIIKHDPRKEGMLERITIRPLKGGKDISDERGRFRVEVPQSKIPKPWKAALQSIPPHRRKLVGVCYCYATEPMATTLFHKRNLKSLEYRAEEASIGKIRLWDGQDLPSEGKPSLEDSCTSYQVGGIPVELEASHY